MESPKTSDSNTVEYWRKQAKYYEQKVNDIQQELDEYTENSAQLEKELEASLVQVEKQNRDLEHQNQRLKNEIDLLRNKLDRSINETNALENELQALKIEQDKQAAYIRELEQKNDDLERGQRVISESVSCIEALLNQAYERNAVLESEVDEIENLRVKLQRATDEARDLKQELKVVELIPTHKKEDNTNDSPILNGCISNSSRAQVDIDAQTILSSAQKREINGNAMTPSTRVSAINIVGDLLRKVGLERFLCRECGKVKCSCDIPTPSDNSAALNEVNDKKFHADNKIVEGENASIEYRHSRELMRQHSGPENCSRLSPKLSHNVVNKSSEHFVRQGENGKLRRSFAVRSREGLENLFSFTSVKKGQDQGRPNQVPLKNGKK